MRLEDAQTIIHEVHGKSYSWLEAWGLGPSREAIRTIRDRKSATAADLELAEDVNRKIYRRW
jgi:hypothetical protein